VLLEKAVNEPAIEGALADLRNCRGPPRRRRFTAMEAHPAEKPRITEHQGPRFLVKHEVVMAIRLERGRMDAQSPRHPEVQSEPRVTREPEEHLLSVGGRMKNPGAGKMPRERARIRIPKDRLRRMQLHSSDEVPGSWIPNAAIELHVGKLGHADNLQLAFPHARFAA
jgi:hypothetical protein